MREYKNSQRDQVKEHLGKPKLTWFKGKKVHQYSNTTSVLTRGQGFLWEGEAGLCRPYLQVGELFGYHKHQSQSQLLDDVWRGL